MSGSIWLYLILLATCVVFAKYAQETRQGIYWWAVMLFLTLFAGLRGVSVGVDTPKYTQIFRMLAEGYPDAWFGEERTFLNLVRALQCISESPTFLFLLFAFITNLFVFWRIWDFRYAISLPWSVFYYYACFYFFTFNVMRQMVAVAIVFWGTRYIQKGKYIPFLIAVAVACIFHQSALLGLAFLAGDILFKNKWDWQGKLKAYKKKLLPIVSALGVLVLIGGIVVLRASGYLRYFTNVTLNLGVLVPMKLCFVAAFIWLVKQKSGKWGGTDGLTCEYCNKNVTSYYGLGLLLSLFGYFYSFMDRIGLYFLIFGCVFVGYIWRRAKTKWLLYVIFAVLLILPFIKDLFAGGHGQLPYKFFWQT